MTYGNGVSTSFAYDDNLRMREMNHSGSVGGYQYNYDKVGNKLFEKDTRREANNRSFACDDFYRLKKAWYGVTHSYLQGVENVIDTMQQTQKTSGDALQSATDPVQRAELSLNDPTAFSAASSYDLDNLGNRESANVQGVSHDYTTSNDNDNTYSQITIGGENFNIEHDDNGNVTARGGDALVFDAFNRLIRYTKEDESIDFALNATITGDGSETLNLNDKYVNTYWTSDSAAVDHDVELTCGSMVE